MKNFNLKNYLLYGTSSKEDYFLVRDRVVSYNLHLWSFVTPIFFAIFLGSYLTSFSLDSIQMNSITYLVCAIIELCCTILLFTVAKKKEGISSIVIFIECIVIFTFAILTGAVFDTTLLSVSFMVVLIAVPLFIICQPYQLAILELIAIVVFCIITDKYKTGATREIDIFNAIAFGFLGQFVTFFVINTKMKFLIAQKQVETLSTMDQLTGIHNRNEYQKTLDELCNGTKEFVYVSMDVNGLKKTNDTYGHLAGDELIVGAASCISKVFNKYGTVYRIGGDEFVALVTEDKSQIEEIVKEFYKEVSLWRGQLIDKLSVSLGFQIRENGLSQKDLISQADESMYDNKKFYYRNNA